MPPPLANAAAQRRRLQTRLQRLLPRLPPPELWQVTKAPSERAASRCRLLHPRQGRLCTELPLRWQPQESLLLVTAVLCQAATVAGLRRPVSAPLQLRLLGSAPSRPRWQVVGEMQPLPLQWSRHLAAAGRHPVPPGAAQVTAVLPGLLLLRRRTARHQTETAEAAGAPEQRAAEHRLARRDPLPAHPRQLTAPQPASWHCCVPPRLHHPQQPPQAPPLRPPPLRLAEAPRCHPSDACLVQLRQQCHCLLRQQPLLPLPQQPVLLLVLHPRQHVQLRQQPLPPPLPARPSLQPPLPPQRPQPPLPVPPPQLQQLPPPALPALLPQLLLLLLHLLAGSPTPRCPQQQPPPLV